MTNNQKGVTLTQEEILNNLNPKNRVIKSQAVQAQEAASVDPDDIDNFNSKENMLDMFRSIQSYNKMLNQKITLINGPLTASIPFTRENLYLFCAYTGSGKSTVAANISYPLWKEGKKILVISNEESRHDVLFRIGCLELGLNFNDFKKGKMPPEEQEAVMRLMPKIGEFVRVLDISYKEGLMTKLEGIKSALNSIKDKDYSCVMIDYYQLIQYSTTQPDKTRYDVLNDLRIFLGQFIKSAPFPVVLFVQLYSQGKRPSKDIDQRIKECSAIVEPATVIIEIIPNWGLDTSDFVIHKDRFGLAGNRIVCGFDKGRFVKIDSDEVANREKDARRKKAEQDLQALEQKVAKDK